MIEFMQRNRGRSMSTPGPLYGTKFNTQRYKSEICQRYMESGQCKYGEKCQFAHGEHELRVINKHPKFKTVPCKTFHQSGTVSDCEFLFELALPCPKWPISSKYPTSATLVSTSSISAIFDQASATLAWWLY